MQRILIITGKELYSTFRDRNLILIMILTPIMLSTIMGLAFGGLSGDGMSAFENIPIAVVNLDEGFDLADQIPEGAEGQLDGLPPSLTDLEIEVGGETVNVGQALQSNPNMDVTAADISAQNASFNFGNILTNILVAAPLTATTGTTATASSATTQTAQASLSLEDLSCPLWSDGSDEETGGEVGGPMGFQGGLDTLLDAVEIDDAAAARSGVEQGDYVAAVIIPPNFTDQLTPTFDFFNAGDTDGGAVEPAAGAPAIPVTNTAELTAAGTLEIYANAGQSISASIVRAVVEGIVNQFVRMDIALESVLNTSAENLLDARNADSWDELDLSDIDAQQVITGLQGLDNSLFDPVACLLLPGAGTVQLVRQPLEEVQTRSAFVAIMIFIGSAQSIFFALFTGIFGVNSIYEERDNWTLQRLIAAPMPPVFIMAGKLLGTVLVVLTQLVILFSSITVIASIVEREPTFIWGTNIPALFTALLGISIFVCGVGVLVVGLAKNSQQVQFFGPLVALTMGALGGAFGFNLPPQVAMVSPIWWGTQVLERIADGEIDTLTQPLLVLFVAGAVTFILGTVLFRRRMQL